MRCREESFPVHDDVELADEVASVRVDFARVDGGDERREGHGLRSGDGEEEGGEGQDATSEREKEKR